jgi:homoserine O-acetyltransferase
VDTHRYFVLCANVVGGCQGSSGPASINPATGRAYGIAFPSVTIRDMVRTQHRWLQSLGVTALHAVVGGSMVARRPCNGRSSTRTSFAA